MVLTLPSLKAHIDHAIGGTPSMPMDYISLVNQAGEYLTTIHPWKWLENNEAKLHLRANVKATLLDFATGTDGRDTLTPSSGTPFSAYKKVTGDLVEITSGTNVNLGFYSVDSVSGSSLKVVAQSLINNTPDTISTTGGALSNNDIACTIHTNRVALPKDFAELIAISTTSGLLEGVQLTSYDDLLRMKGSSMSPANFYWAAVTQARDLAGPNKALGSEPVTPSLEIWPSPTSDETAALTIYYRSGWPYDLFTPADPEDVTPVDSIGLRIPRYLEAFFIQLIRAFAQGYEQSEVASLDQRLSHLLGGTLFASAVNRDGSVQPHYGTIQHGAAESPILRGGFENFNTISAPS